MRMLGILCIVSTGWAAEASSDQIGSAAANGVALIQASQKNWNVACYSCHQQLLPQLAFRAAREHGIALDEQAAHVAAARGFGFLSDLDRAVQYTHMIDPAISDGYVLVGGEAAGVRANLATAVYARLVAVRQKPDGHWETMDVRPPQSYSSLTATAIAARAIQLYSHPSLAADTKSRLNRARNWLAARPTAATEERAMQLLGLAWTGADRALLDKLARALKEAQQSDGGWPSREGRPSDAYSTGEALVALQEATSTTAADAAWRHGIQYLVATQAEDGSWHVKSRMRPPAPISPPYFETGYPYGHDQFISVMGATWAVRALAAALEAAKTVEMPVLHEATLTAEPWAEAALFGNAAELKALLEKGLDPNSATKAGGTTLLMMAQPDLEKTRLLVEHGAKINARARTRYSALMVAAQYPGSAPVMRFLLDRGAEVHLPKGGGAPLFNASPLVLASGAGNAEILPRLCQAGDKVDSKMLLLGGFPATALLSTVFFHETAAARALLDAGAKVDQPDENGITPLGWAAIGNETGVARVLIERGADVNHVDQLGMTPLLYAASIDFGDSSTIELLAKSGANPNARTKEGLTADELARKYGHTHLTKSLSAGL